MTVLTEAPELAGYHDEPAQLPSGAPGKNGYLRLGFAVRGSRTELVDLDRRTPLLVQQALHFDEAMPEAACVFMVSTSGGVLQGDRNTIEIDVGADAHAHLTTQAATKIQEMDANFATQSQRITVHEGAYCEYLPEPIIPYRHSRYVSTTHLVVAAGATLLYSEILLPGRTYYGGGERFAYDVFSSTIRATRPDGRDLFIEKFVIEPALFHPQRRGVLGDFEVLGNVVLLTPPDIVERVISRVPAVVGRESASGASRLPNDAGLIFKALGMDSEPVKAQVRAFWTVVRDEVVGRELAVQFRWR